MKTKGQYRQSHKENDMRSELGNVFFGFLCCWALKSSAALPKLV